MSFLKRTVMTLKSGFEFGMQSSRKGTWEFELAQSGHTPRIQMILLRTSEWLE